ncbi:TetR/AcrR family transcriptional regulator [Alkalibacter mobilis]|uniref:TetR/AcrR family transcriptional regulator n=1 Tax=Alkalibacter mobilis TaxID=2787712 RepID=UPI0018A0C680|nr:TetR/AcrR family transcriptional regulator [Alkalibacter mobilis]MBF7097552.1 TetR/AcrR family transcriptional regulator [Alkalibacter mobilis]
MKKEQIILKAIEILAKKGYANTTTRMISERAGIAVGSLYTHFKSKDAILDHIFQNEYKKRAVYIDHLKEKECKHIEKIGMFLDFHFDELGENRDLMTVLVRESANPELQHLDGVKEFTEQLPLFFKSILEKAMENGEIRKLNADLTAEIIFSTIRGTVCGMAAKSEIQELEKIKKELKKFINNAVKNQEEFK